MPVRHSSWRVDAARFISLTAGCRRRCLDAVGIRRKDGAALQCTSALVGYQRVSLLGLPQSELLYRRLGNSFIRGIEDQPTILGLRRVENVFIWKVVISLVQFRKIQHLQKVFVGLAPRFAKTIGCQRVFQDLKNAR
jgi:hypothetical protein